MVDFLTAIERRLQEEIFEGYKNVGSQVVENYQYHVGRNCGLADALAMIKEVAAVVLKEELE